MELLHLILSFLTFRTLLDLRSGSKTLLVSTSSYLQGLTLPPSQGGVSTEPQLEFLLRHCPRLKTLKIPWSDDLERRNLFFIRAAAEFPDLARLDAANDTITEDLLEHPEVLKKLVSVSLEEDMDPEGKSQCMSSLQAVTKLRLAGGFTDPLPPMPLLESLSLTSIDFLDGMGPLAQNANDYFLHGERMPSLKSLQIKASNLPTEWLATLAQCQHLEFLALRQCEPPAGTWTLHFPHITHLDLEDLSCNQGHLVSCVRRHLPQLMTLTLSTLPVALCHSLGGAPTKLEDLEMYVTSRALTAEETEAAPAGVRGDQDLCLDFLDTMPNILSVFISRPFPEDEEPVTARFPTELGSWASALVSIRLNVRVDLPSLQSAFPLFTSLVDLCLGDSSAPLANETESLTLSNPAVVNLGIFSTCTKILGDLPKLTSIEVPGVPLKVSIDGTLPALVKLSLTGSLLEMGDDTAGTFLGDVVEKAPNFTRIVTDRFSPDLFEVLQESPVFLIFDQEGGPVPAYVREVSHLLAQRRQHHQPISEAFAQPLSPVTFHCRDAKFHRASNIPDYFFEARPEPAVLVNEHPQARGIVVYSAHSRSCPFESSSCPKGFFGI